MAARARCEARGHQQPAVFGARWTAKASRISTKFETEILALPTARRDGATTSYRRATASSRRATAPPDEPSTTDDDAPPPPDDELPPPPPDESGDAYD